MTEVVDLTGATTPTPYVIAAIVNGTVVDTISCDEHFWALYTSSPTFVDITDNPGQYQIGDSYSV